MNNSLDINSKNLQQELNWLSKVFEQRFNYSFVSPGKCDDVYSVSPPVLDTRGSPYADFVYKNDLTFGSRLLLILGMVTHIQPGFMDRKFNGVESNHYIKQEIDKKYTKLHELGGIKTENYRGFIPTGLTWLFLLAGYDISSRIKAMSELDDRNILIRENIISFTDSRQTEPLLSGAIGINMKWLRLFTIGDIEIKIKQVNTPGL